MGVQTTAFPFAKQLSERIGLAVPSRLREPSEPAVRGIPTMHTLTNPMQQTKRESANFPDIAALKTSF